MTAVTITEALAEIKTIGKRLESKRQFIVQNVARPSVIVDPLAKEGGSEKRMAEEIQAYGDLVKRIETIRVSVQKANQSNTLTIEGQANSVAGWLAFRKECAAQLRSLYGSIAAQIKGARAAMEKQSTAASPVSVVTHFSEDEVAKRSEAIEKVLGALDGKLSLFNATCTIEIP